MRVTVKDTIGSPVDSWSDYYPFGKIARSSVSSNSPKEKFIGQPFDEESNLNLFGVRYYNAEIGRFMTNDPLARKFPSMSPYNYAMNNPIRLLDPSGKAPEDGDEKKKEKTTDNKSQSNNNGSKQTENKSSDSKSNGNWWGVYAGPNNPSDSKGNPDYTTPPIDAADAAAKEHDVAYDANNGVGVSDALTNTNNGIYIADKNLTTAEFKVVGSYLKGIVDPYTAAPVSTSTAGAATLIGTAFGAITIAKTPGNTVRNAFNEVAKAIYSIVPSPVGK